MSRAHPRPNLAPRPSAYRAVVLDVLDEDRVLVRATGAPTAEVREAEVAVMGYAPAAGDGVLVEQLEDGVYVLGVLGAARRRLTVQATSGGVELRLREGDLTLSAAGGVVLRGRTVHTEAEGVHTAAREVVTVAGRIETDAGRLVERSGDAYRHVEGLAELRAGRARTLVEGALQVEAERTTVRSDGDTVIDGKRVLLG